MSYSANFEKVRIEGLKRQVGTKILDMMEKLNLSSNENNRSRWIWELLQNAKDVAYPGKQVNIKINFDSINKKIEFSHDGRPFSSKNITFLIEQVSTKERNQNSNEEIRTTGKFGTGFLTTHLLSKIVEVEGIVKDEDEPYKKFNIVIDRSGDTVDKICTGVDKAMHELDIMDEKPNFNSFNEDEFNTKFIYKLDDEGLLVAQKGLKDLENSLIYTMVFVPEIKSVSIVSSGTKYYRNSKQNIENMRIETVLCDEGQSQTSHHILVYKEQNIMLAFPIEVKNDIIFFKEINKLVPRLFCDFPLGDTKDFILPVIINNSFFHPDEPRETIYLSNKEDRKITENKASILVALSVFNKVLNYASKNNFGNLILLAAHKIKVNEWIDQGWLKKEVSDPLRNELCRVKIVDTCSGERVSILNEFGRPNVWFPSNKDKNLRKEIWELSSLMENFCIPKADEVDLWAKLMWFDEPKLTLEVLANIITTSNNIEKFKMLFIEKDRITEYIDWLNHYYDIALMDGDFKNKISNENYPIFLNQLGEFTSCTSLKIDKDIAEEVKDIAEVLNIDCRKKLLSNLIRLDKALVAEIQDIEDVMIQINKVLLSDSLDHAVRNRACFLLLELLPNINSQNHDENRILLQSFCRRAFPNTVFTAKYLENWTDLIWEESTKLILKMLILEISNHENIDKLKENKTFESNGAVLDFINSVVLFLENNNVGKDYLNDVECTILPNQNGKFISKDEIYLDNGDIDEKLKDISKELGTDFREELLNVKVYLKLPENRTKNKQDIADKISSLVLEKIKNSSSLDSKTKESFRSLVVWFKDNQEEAKQIFGDLYKHKHRLYDEDLIAENLNKAEKFDDFLIRHNVTISELESLLYASETTGENSTSVEIQKKSELTTEDLIQLGIYSEDELKIAMENDELKKQFTHSSSNNQLKFNYVQELLNRSKMNIMDFLKSKPEYDITDFIEVSKTIFLVRKKGEDIFIVTRPSDYNQIIIYYDTEKDILDFEKDWEIWVENGKDIPQKISFGKILKLTGINRIPLYSIR